LLVLAAGACGGGGGKSNSTGTTTPAAAAATGDVSGTYTVVQDSDGTKPIPGATVTLVLDNGTLAVRAVSGADELTDSGTYSVHDGKMTIEFKEQGFNAKDQPYKLDGDTLEIPVKMFSEGAGSSTWKRAAVGAADAEPTTSDDGSANVGAPRAPSGLSELKPDWSLFDDNYATAAAMKTYVESVNDKHMTLEAAVTAAVAKAKTFKDVTGVDVSPNGLNAIIRYKDGRDEDFLTERFSVTEGGISASGERTSERYVSAEPAPAGEPCRTLPAVPEDGAVKTSKGRTVQPGREGLQPAPAKQKPPPPVVFGVTGYDAQKQPKPISSDDSPPASERRALLFAPLYDVPHPGPVYSGASVKDGMWSGFRKGSGGNNIECIAANLERGGYKPDTILGRIEGGKPVETGIDAFVKLTQKLTSTSYGVIYIMTHGAEINNSVLRLEMGTLSDEDRKAVIGERKIGHGEETTLEDAIRVKMLREAGLSPDEDLKLTIRANIEASGRLEIWVSSEFFRLLRENEGVSFANTLVFVNACSSAANQGLVKAFDAKAFFGFQRPPDLSFSSDAAQEMTDLLPDKARSARNAWQMWVRFHAWSQAFSKAKADDRTKISILKAYGKFGVEYAPITDQSVLLIFRARHAPTSGKADITTAIANMHDCAKKFWSAGKRATFGNTGCRNWELGGVPPPTDAEVADAVFELGGGGDASYGRWTMTD
jgi:hypothetical protein